MIAKMAIIMENIIGKVKIIFQLSNSYNQIQLIFQYLYYRATQMQIQIEEAHNQLKNQIKDISNISDDFFKKCQDLYQIQKSFSLMDIDQQVKNRDTDSQFQLLRALTQTKKHKMRFRVNNAIQNKKNRYPQQSIYDFSRVILPKNNLNLTKNKEGYINANYIKSIEKNNNNKMILTQGPVQNTTEQFMEMIQTEKIQCLVMLCRLMENGKNRCADYLAKHKKQLIKKIAEDTIQISKITIMNQNNADQYSFVHIAYSQWPDKSVPLQISHIRQLIDQILPFNRLCIHCSAGLGRSGVIAAILLIQKDDDWINKKELSVFRQVRKMREYRFGAVQNSEQYNFIYKYFKHLFKKDKR